MKIILINRKNNNIETFNDLSLENISAFVDREFGWDQKNGIGFVHLYKTLGELHTQTPEFIEYTNQQLTLMYKFNKTTRIGEPTTKDRYDLCLLRLINFIDDIVSKDYIGKYEDGLYIDEVNKEIWLEGHKNLNHNIKYNYTINLSSFLNQLDIDLVVE